MNEEYTDSLGEGSAPDLARLAEALGQACRVFPSHRTSMAIRENIQRPSGKWRRRFPVSARVYVAAAFALIVLISGGAAWAVSTVTNLGKPEPVVSQAEHFPLDGFTRIPTSLRKGGKPEFLYLYISNGGGRLHNWPVVKALNQFGTWQNVRRVDTSCQQVTFQQHQVTLCQEPTLDLSHASYHSRYLSFVGKVVGTNGRTRIHFTHNLTPQENALFQQYACKPASKPCPSAHEVVSDPLEIIQNYKQIQTQFLFGVDFTPPLTGTATEQSAPPFSFAQIQKALQTGTEPAPGSTLVTDVNAEANILTALICHADGSRPASVCGRSVIRQIRKDVK